jgi:TolB protein
MAPDGTHQHQLIDRGQSPAYNPSGWRLAFSRAGGIWTMRSDGSQLRQLTHGGSDDDPAYSPDGDRIAFSRSRGGIWTMRSDGSDRRQLTHNGTDRDPAYSPNGDRIAFSRGAIDINGSADPCSTWTMRSDGSDKRFIHQDSDPLFDHCWTSADPAYFPSGERIAVVHSIYGPHKAWIETMRPDGSGVRKLTPRVHLGDQITERSPAFSPDGRRIVFSGDPTRRPDGGPILGLLYTVRTDGSHLRKLTSGQFDLDPTWGRISGQ